MADAAGLDFDQHLACARALQVDGFNGQWLAGFPGDGGFGLHGVFLGILRLVNASDKWLAGDYGLSMRAGFA
jgi:hypothetical protein